MVTGRPVLEQTTEPKALHISAQPGSAGTWITPIWIEEGRYRVEYRLKTQGVLADPAQPLGGAGLRVWSNRKISSGIHWSWFPYNTSRDPLRRGEIVVTNFVARRLTGTTGWTDLTYEIELRQPMADLEVRCELYANAGEAWFDPDSVRITRLTDTCP